jgi:curved DNA-binding protein CbpA
MIFKNYYHILGISSDASQLEIKKAFRKLSIKFHPDKNEGDPFLSEMFKNINEAYEVLSNPDKKTFFDESLELMKGFNEPYLNQQKVKDPELEHLKKLTQMYLDKKDLESIKLNEFNSAETERIIHRPGMYSLMILWGFILLLSLIIVTHWKKVQKATEKASENNYYWATLIQTPIYSKADTLSDSRGLLPANTKLRTKQTLNDFVKIFFINSEGILTEGYLEKRTLIFRNKKTELIQSIIHPKRIIKNEEKAKEIYQIIITHDPNFDISTLDDDYLVQSKNDKFQYKYVIISESIEEFQYDVDLNIEVVKDKFKSMGFHFDTEQYNKSIGHDVTLCYQIELIALQASKTNIKYTYRCD